MTDAVAGDLRTFSHVKDADQETYDVVMASALALVNSDSPWQQATGKLLFVLLNAWERGELRYCHLAVMSAALDVATSEQLEHKFETDLELIQMVEAVIDETA